MRAWLAPLNNTEDAYRVLAEREVSRRLGGSCEVPLAAYAHWSSKSELSLKALVASQDGTKIVQAQGLAIVEDANAAIVLGTKIANELIAQGADALVALTK